LTLPEGGSLELNIPPGVRDGQVLRLHGKGAPSPGEGEAGDAFVEISINPHRFFTRQGDDIYLDLPITLKEAFRPFTTNLAGGGCANP
jgi:DnaJ-class molecular chaperone